MRIPPSFISGALLVLAIVLWAIPFQISAQDAEEIKLAPQVEEKIKAVKADLRNQKLSAWNIQMQAQIHNIVQLTGMGQPGMDALNAASRPILESCADHWTTTAEMEFRKGVEEVPAEDSYKELAMLTSLGSDSIGILDLWVQSSSPLDSEAWNAAIHTALTPDQAAVWDKAQAAQNDAINKKLDAGLAPYLKQLSTQETQLALNRSSSIATALGLTGDRKQKLEDIARAAADASAEQWAQNVKASLHHMDGLVLAQVLAAFGTIKPVMHVLDIKFNDGFAQQLKWKDGLTKLLTSHELDKLQSLKKAQKTERIHVMAQVFIALIDEKIALNSNQRDQLLPLAERLVKDIPELFPDEGVEYEGSTLSMYYREAQNAIKTDLKPILDDNQIQTWEALSNSEPDQALGQAEPSTEPEYVESAIAHNMYERELQEQRHLLESFSTKANDVIRKAGLDSERASHLQLAARGYAEKQMAAWRFQTEQQVRNQLSGVTADTVDARLSSVQIFAIGWENQLAPIENLWDKTVQSELTPAQIAAWKEETDARETYRIKAIAALALSSFAHLEELTDDQKQKLAPLIEKSVREYSLDISRFFSDQGGVLWYLTKGFSLLPINGLSKTELSSTLNPSQSDIWNSCDEEMLMINIWPGIQQQHLGRIREEETAAQAKKAGK